MKNYQKLNYHEYRIMLSDGSSILTTRQECFSIEPASEDCPFKQRWYYSPDQYMAVRLPRNELGERLGKDNAADLKAQERLIQRNQERNLEIDAYTTEDGASLDIPAPRLFMEVYMEISTFNNSEFGEIRTIQKNGEVLFCGSDVAKALGYSNTRDALSRHCKGVVKCDTPTNGGVQTLGFISEGDVYRLIAHSKLPGAERFESWVFDEVLPSIRKNGAYMTDDVLEQALTSPDFLIELATRLKAEKAKNAQLTVSNQIMQPKADYFDMLVDRNLLTGIRDTAKELGIRQNVFVRFLLDKGYLYRSKKGKLRPYATYVDSGLFELKEFVNDKTGYTDTQTLITPKGKETFRLLCI